MLSGFVFGAGPGGECISVLRSSKHPECEHFPAQLQPTDIRQTGALHGWPRKQMYFQLTREQLYLSKWFLPSGGCVQWKTQRNVNPLKQSTWSWVSSSQCWLSKMFDLCCWNSLRAKRTYTLLLWWLKGTTVWEEHENERQLQCTEWAHRLYCTIR